MEVHQNGAMNQAWVIAQALRNLCVMVIMVLREVWIYTVSCFALVPLCGIHTILELLLFSEVSPALWWALRSWQLLRSVKLVPWSRQALLLGTADMGSFLARQEAFNLLVPFLLACESFVQAPGAVSQIPLTQQFFFNPHGSLCHLRAK